MKTLAAPLALASAIGLSACAVAPPNGPSFAAMPGPGKSFAEFQQDDFRCRQTANAANGNVTPGQAATQSGVGSAIVGTGLGAAAGALLGAAAGNAGAGAAIGAGTGLLAGSAIGADNAQTSAAGMQRNYDVTYAQCMSAAGESVPNPNAVAPAGYGYPPPGYGYGYGYGYAPPVAYAPPVYVAPPIGRGIGFGWGAGWGGGWGGGYRRW